MLLYQFYFRGHKGQVAIQTEEHFMQFKLCTHTKLQFIYFDFGCNFPQHNPDHVFASLGVYNRKTISR